MKTHGGGGSGGEEGGLAVGATDSINLFFFFFLIRYSRYCLFLLSVAALCICSIMTKIVSSLFLLTVCIKIIFLH